MDSGSCSISVDCMSIPFGTSMRTHPTDKIVLIGVNFANCEYLRFRVNPKVLLWFWVALPSA